MNSFTSGRGWRVDGECIVEHHVPLDRGFMAEKSTIIQSTDLDDEPERHPPPPRKKVEGSGGDGHPV